MQTNQRMVTEEIVRDWAVEVDVVIIGSGFSGLAAAVEAGNAGAPVMVIEKKETVAETPS